MKVALVQMTSSDDPSENLESVRAAIRRASDEKADFVLTPEVTNCVSASRTRQREVLREESEDETLSALRRQAAEAGLWVLVGSLALKTSDPDGRFANRSFLISPEGRVSARYDKIHMFDVTVSETETYRESAGYRPGQRAVLAQAHDACVGMTICYDLRFPGLYRLLAQSGAEVLTVPSAFSPVTGAAHWEILLRARAIETGCFVLAPAQTGTHPASRGRARQTYGHSMIVAPWGEVVLDAGTDPGVHVAEIDLAAVRDARERIPAWRSNSTFRGP